MKQYLQQIRQETGARICEKVHIQIIQNNICLLFYFTHAFLFFCRCLLQKTVNQASGGCALVKRSSWISHFLAQDNNCENEFSYNFFNITFSDKIYKKEHYIIMRSFKHLIFPDFSYSIIHYPYIILIYN